MFETIRNFLWTHPWWHGTILVGLPVLITAILSLRELAHSKEANRLRKEANNLRSELDTERNRHLQMIAENSKQPPTKAEKNAIKLRKYLRQRAWVNEQNNHWGANGAEIVEVNEDNILTLFTPAGYSSSTAFAVPVHCEDLQIVEMAKGGCTLQLNILSRYGNAYELGQISSWDDRTKASTPQRPRGRNLFHVNFNKQGSPTIRGIYIYAPIDGSTEYTLVTFVNGEEKEIIHGSNVDLSKKCVVMQVEYLADGFQKSNSGYAGNSEHRLFLL